MDNFWQNLLIELALFTLLGVLYYFYQKKKILQYEKDKGPIVAGHILQCCLMEREDESNSELDGIISALDDYLHNRAQTLPTALLKHYAQTPICSPELKAVIEEGIAEWEK